jgi:hypothetical protein
MMTALVACLGLLPAALSTGIGSDTQKPFAIVIVAGLAVVYGACQIATFDAVLDTDVARVIFVVD